MDSKVFLQPAYILHRLPFQNTSLLVDFFTMDFGRVRAVAKGARSAKSKYRSLLQPFHPLLVSLSGRGDLKTVTGIESGLAAINLQGLRLFSGLYVNELLVRMLLNHVEHKELYKAYQSTIVALQGAEDIETVLRRFELNLLAELGYAINLEVDCHSHEPIQEGESYLFTPDIGFELVKLETSQHSSSRLYKGEHIVALRQLKLIDKDIAKSAKRLLRTALGTHLGGKPLNSRNLFTSRT
ncbi:MAG: DNA repair protein RecO [SAR86 cluster bacterium]|uniref:DNA repair protein RecO n=1 Tax=SAR86 cluster bacterium TaxID=2030880 RepID=A0A2A5B0E5_9GAMM|nr:MAG: DNA repair protein RecO [SAR86 cluster bacterium]